MSISTSHAAIDGYEPVPVPGPVAAGRPATAMLRRRSLLPSRRAVLRVQAAGDPDLPSGLGEWFTERGFHFYLAGLGLPPRRALPGRRALPWRAAGRPLTSAFADLDAACTHLREADGIGHVIVTAHGRSALAVALWCDARSDDPAAGPADALILAEPALPACPAISLNVACPVLVLTSPGSAGVSLPRGRPAAANARLGSHVTWLQLPVPEGQAVFAELGRWLGAYMYGPGQDRLL